MFIINIMYINDLIHILLYNCSILYSRLLFLLQCEYRSLGEQVSVSVQAGTSRCMQILRLFEKLKSVCFGVIRRMNPLSVIKLRQLLLKASWIL